MVVPDVETLTKQYDAIATKHFFQEHLKFMSSGPAVFMVLEGLDAVRQVRRMIGDTDPQKTTPGTIRGDHCIYVCCNLCHGSDTPEDAKREIGLWFDEKELIQWEPCHYQWTYI
eukprot:GHVR01156782.1.p2 GENE.GHVR01156782.1~~GHVR01156782.1.p2  ORF type:complete len:114 (+),score=22.83 GHVR01156782.1:397-738(+)